MARVIKKIADKLLASILLVCISPIMLIAAIGIKLTNNGPIIYKAQRMGKDMTPITVYKFRTMIVGAEKYGAITKSNDDRVFKWGKILRDTKIDELPQLFNIINGTMSIVGPRPEDIDIVNQYYTDEEKKTLQVSPGLLCVGSIFNYTHGDQYLNELNTDTSYGNSFMHMKLKLDMYYLEHWTLLYDARLIFRAAIAIISVAIFHCSVPYPKEYYLLFEPKAASRE